MKKINNYLRLMAMTLAVGIFASSCSSDDPVEEPLAFFTAEVDATNPLMVNFTNESLRGDAYSWDFGDGTAASTDENPSHAYAAAGTYSVVLTATNAGGSDTHTESVVAAEAEPVNLIVNGGFDDDSNWTIINHYKSDNENGDIVIAEGVATWTDLVDTEYKHMGLYQEIQLEAGTYKFDMHVDFADINEVWGEVYVGATVPTNGTETDDSDYIDNKVLNAYNSWNCVTTYSGMAAASGCDTEGAGVFTLETSGTYYVVIRSGGLTYGPTGVKVDNVSLFAQ